MAIRPLAPDTSRALDELSIPTELLACRLDRLFAGLPVLSLIALEGLLNGRFEFLFKFPWFGDVLVNFSLVDRGKKRGYLRITGKDDSDDLRVLFFYDLEQFEAVHLGHANVGDDHLHLVFFENLKSLFAAEGKYLPLRFIKKAPLQGL